MTPLLIDVSTWDDLMARINQSLRNSQITVKVPPNIINMVREM